MSPLDPFIHTHRIAYFSMEIALRDDIPTYAGGLGVLAGDMLRSAADLDIPLIGVTLISRCGYFKQIIDVSGNQSELCDLWQAEEWAIPLAARVAVPIEAREVWVRPWLYVMQGSAGHSIPVILLDTDLPDNKGEDRKITDELYGRDQQYRLKQEIVLGIGGARILQALGFAVHRYHINEGHSALLALELLWRFKRSSREVAPGESVYDVGRVRELCLFTTHTPVEAGSDNFPYPLVHEILDDFIDFEELKRLGGGDQLNMTRLALNLSGYVNGVAKRHASVSNHMFPDYRVHAITNGVHPSTWTCEPIARLYDRYVPEWRHEPEILVRAERIPDTDLWEAHMTAKQSLVDFVLATTGKQLDPWVPILGFARRMTAYKRPDLLFHDISRLRSIASKRPFQIVIGGKAHPNDDAGKHLIRQIHGWIEELAEHITVVFLPDYNMKTALRMAAGSDVWINTPLRPLEASGTSGMKAAFNGVAHLSVLDGWWVEGFMEGVTGWAIGSSETSPNGEDAEMLYRTLSNEILPLYYEDRSGWLRVMKGAITKNACYFNSHRMMRRYAAEAYLY